MFEDNLSLKRLKLLIEVGKTGHFGRTAVRLGVSQPVLTREIRRLENEAGVQLLVRHSKGVVLTTEGANLTECAQNIFAELAHYSHASPTIRSSGNDRILNIGIEPGLATLFVGRLERCIRQTALYDEVRFIEAPDLLLVEDLRASKLDLVIAYNPPSIDGIQSSKICDEEIVSAIPPMWDTTDVNEWTNLKELATRPLILPSEKSGLRRLLQKKAAQLNIKLTPMIETDSVATLKSLVFGGYGIAVTSRRLFYADEKLGRAQIFALSSLNLKLRLHVCTRLLPSQKSYTTKKIIIETVELAFSGSGFLSTKAS